MWRVVKNSNPRLPPFGVHAVAAGAAPPPRDTTVLWEGEAPSRPDAWQQAVLAHSWLKDVAMPNPFESVDVFERIHHAPKTTVKLPKRRGRPPKQVEVSAPQKTASTSQAGLAYGEIAKSRHGMTAAEVDTALGLKRSSISVRLLELAAAGCIRATGEMRGNPPGKVFELVPGVTFDRYYEWHREDREARKKGREIMDPCKLAILTLAYEKGAYGVTLTEMISVLGTQFEAGTIRGESKYLRDYGWMVPHPTGATRETPTGKHTDVFVLELDNVLPDWQQRVLEAAGGKKKMHGHQIVERITDFLRASGIDGATEEEIKQAVSPNGEFPRDHIRLYLIREMRSGAIIQHPEGLMRTGKTGREVKVLVLATPINKLAIWAREHDALRGDLKFEAVFKAIDQLQANGKANGAGEVTSSSSV